MNIPHTGELNQAELSKILHKISKESLNKTKVCYIIGCSRNIIKAHSVSNARYLNKIAFNGEVLYLNSEDSTPNILNLKPTGRAKATTFPGFCDVHDKIFEPIDNNDYVIGDKKQEYLFALRAAAREFTVRQGFEKMLKNALEGKFPDLKIPDAGRDYLRQVLKGFSVGTKDLISMREPLNINYLKSRYWKIKSSVLILENEYPIVASSTFKLEVDIKGKVINPFIDLKIKSRPLFFTLAPQNGKTYCILSWFHHDDTYFSNMEGLNEHNDNFKRIIISNLLTSYVENFAVNPTYWNSLSSETINSFQKQWGITMHEHRIPFIYNNNLNLFV